MASSSTGDDPWFRALDKFREDLSAEERDVYSNATLENLIDTASAAQKLHQQNSKLQRIASKLQPFTAAIEQYGAALDVYSNTSGVIACPVWGTLRVLLKVCAMQLRILAQR
jgi:hypothetical protein